jgi:hypothetical protein
MRKVFCYGNEFSNGINFSRHGEMPTAISKDINKGTESEKGLQEEGRRNGCNASTEDRLRLYCVVFVKTKIALMMIDYDK